MKRKLLHYVAWALGLSVKIDGEPLGRPISPTSFVCCPNVDGGG